MSQTPPLPMTPEEMMMRGREPGMESIQITLWNVCAQICHRLDWLIEMVSGLREVVK